MPGRLLAMDQPTSAIALQPVRQEGGTIEDSNHAETDIQMNGSHQVKSEEIIQDISSNINGEKRKSLPPLEDSWRSSPANVSFGKLLQRLATGCYADLAELVTKLSDTPLLNGQPTANGVDIKKEDSDPASLKKKRLLLEFCSTWRERYIKALVISNWARTQGEDVAKIIDLRNTLQERELKYQQCLDGVAQLKTESVGLRQPAPNIKGAMQYLSTGNSSYVDLGYIRPAALRAEQILELTNEMGVQANLRIWLSEPELPFYMSDYTIANGRVTFRTADEFEVDLACIDQNPEKSPWYFVDLRFLFKPTSVVSDSVRPHLEAHINTALATKGLQGCYDFLHNYTMDFKIGQLESQAYALLQQQYFASLRIERLRRVINIQYWPQKDGKKSWLEFHVNSGKDKTSSHIPVTPRNDCRWFKDGKLVDTAGINVDWANLDLEKILDSTQRAHVLDILNSVCLGISHKTPSASLLTIEIVESTVKTDLKVDFTAAHPACTTWIALGISSTTGLWYVEPRTAQTEQLQQKLNSTIDNFTVHLERSACDIMQEGIEFEAQSARWILVKKLFYDEQRAFKKLFDDAIVVTMWRPAITDQALPETWAVACSTNLHSMRWWLVETTSQEKKDFTIKASHELNVPDLPWQGRLQKVASLARTKYHLIKPDHQPIHMLHEHYTSTLMSKEDVKQKDTRFVQLADLYKSHNKSQKPDWAEHIVRVSDERFVMATWKSYHLVTAAIKQGHLQHLRQHLIKHKIPGITINETQLVAQFMSSISTSILDATRTTLDAVTRLDNCLAATSKLGIRCRKLTFDLLDISYGRQHFTAQLQMTDLPQRPVRLRFEQASRNPHSRVRTALEDVLNGQGNTFSLFARILLFTLPLLSTADKLETIKNGVQIAYLHARNATWYTLKYKGKSSVSFTIRARVRTDGTRKKIVWHLEMDRQGGVVQGLPDGMPKALQDFWTNPGTGCQGLSNGLTADAEGIAAALRKLNTIAQQFIIPESPAQVVEAVNAEQPAKAEVSKVDPDVIMLD